MRLISSISRIITTTLVSILIGLLATAVRPQTDKTVQPPAQTSDEKAQKIVQRGLEVVGGSNYLNVRTLIGRGIFSQYKDGSPEVPSKFVDYVVYPDKERTEFTSSGIRTILGNSSGKGWIFDGSVKNLKDQKAEQLEDFNTSMKTGFENLLRGWWRKEGATVSYVGRREAGLARRNETVRLLQARLAQAAAPDRRDRVELIGIEYHWPNLSLAQGFDHVFGHNPLRLRWFYEATRVGDTVAIPPQRSFSPLYPSYHSAFADLLGLRFIATGVPVEEIDSSLKPGDLEFIARTGDAYVYENPRALPRVMLLTDWRLADFEELLRSGWPDVDPRATVLLKKPPIGFSRSAAVGMGGAVRLLRYRNTEVVVEVEAPGGGILLLNDVWQPWWRAEVDGADAEILEADVIFRAVVVPRGRHVVRFTFHPFSGALAELVGKMQGSPLSGR